MKRSKNFLYNSLFSFVNQGVAMLCGLVLPKLKLVYFGSEINGLVSSILQFISYVAIVEAGLQAVSTLALYRVLPTEDQSQISAVMSTIKKYYQKTALIFTLFSIVLAVIYPFFVNVDSLNILEVALLVFVVAIAKSCDFFISSKYIILLSADQRSRVYSVIATINLIFKTVIIAILSVLKMNIVIVYSFLILASFLNAVLLWLYCKKKYPSINYNTATDKKYLAKRYVALGGQIAYLIFSSATIAIATFVLPLTEVSVYSVYALITVNVGGIVFLFSNSIGASFGDVISRKEDDSLKRNFKMFDHAFSMIAVTIFICIGILIVSFITIYTNGISDADYYRPVLGLLMTIVALEVAMCTPLDVIANAAGFYKAGFIITVIQAAIMIGFGFAFVFFWQMEGLAAAMLLANLFRVVAMIVLVKKQYVFMDLKSMILNRVNQFILFFLCLLPFVFIALTPSSYLMWAIIASGVFVGTCLIVFIYNLICNLSGMKQLKEKITAIIMPRTNKIVQLNDDHKEEESNV